MRKRIIGTVAALSLLLLTTPTPASSAPVPTEGGRMMAVPSGPASALTDEDGYNAFPAVAAPASGRLIAVYGSATTHDGPLADLTIRRSTDGAVWGEPQVVAMPLAGYAYQPAGAIAAETAEQGGRIYLAVQRVHWPASGGHTPDEQRYWLYTSDDDGATWQQRAQFPTTPGTWGFGANSMLIQPDGSLLLAGWSSDGVVRFMTSSNRGATLVAAGSIPPPAGRTGGVAQLGRLSDGRVFVVFRSDLAGYDSRYYYAWRTGPAIWGPAAVFYNDATTLGSVTVLNDDTIVVMYRGWSDRTDDGPQFRPLRLLLAAASGTGLTVWRSNVDPNPGIRARFLGGRIVPVPGGDYVCVWGIEGPLTTATAASIVAMPIAFRAPPAATLR